MKKSLVLSVLLSVFTGSLAIADGSDVAIKTVPSEEIFVCNAGREFNSTDDNNNGNMFVSAVGTGISASARPLSRNNPMLAPLSASWGIKITQLNFGISTENYGAGYSIYFCYRGPSSTQKINQNSGKTETGSKDTSGGIYNATAVIASTLKDYANNANLSYNVQLICEFRKAGSAGPAANSGPTTGAVTPQFSGSWGPYYFNSNRQITAQLNSNASAVPSYCMYKVTLTERATGPRPNNLPPAEFSVNLDIFKVADDNSLVETAQ